MDSNKNIIAAISLSAAIIVLWALFFSPSPEDREKIKQKRIDSVKSLDAPEIENSETNNLLSRKEALNKDKKKEAAVDLLRMVIERTPSVDNYASDWEWLKKAKRILKSFDN